ncbi:TetR/AcrR family transcriptional regulator [Brevundimonas kwangchunensis]
MSATAPKPRRAAASKAATKSAKTAKPKSRSKAEQRAESLEQIFDAAEELFSKHGMYGVTLKDVAQKVGVHTSLMHYYFEDKQDLFHQVVKRRAPITIGRRMEALEKYEQETGDHPTVEGALRAFLDTDLDLYIEGGEGWRNYGALGGQVNNAPVWGATLMYSLFDPVVLKLIGLLKKAMPEAADEDIFWGYHFVTGALTLTLARTGRIDHLSGGLCKSEDFEAVKLRMATFMAGGFRAVCIDRIKARSGDPNG